MKSKLFLILCASFLPAVPHPFPPPPVGGGQGAGDAVKKELDQLQGDWALASYVIDGTKLSDDEAQSLFRTVKGDQYTVLLFDKVIFKGTFKIDPSKKPKTIDSYADGMSDKPILGIYEVEGDTLKICSAPPGKDRPKEFTSQKDSGHSLMIWEREKKK